MGGAFSSGGGGSSKQQKPPAATISSTDRAVLDLKNSRDRLSRYKKKLEMDEQKLVSRAKQAKEKGQTKTALNLLRLRKYKLREVETVEGQLLNVLQMVQTIDSKQNEAQMLSAMKAGKDTLQHMHEQMSVDDVIDLMDQIQEQNEVEDEISNIIQQGVPELSMADEAAVEAELEALMQGEGMGVSTPAATTTLPEVPTGEILPQAPTTKLPEVGVATEASKEGRVAVPS